MKHCAARRATKNICLCVASGEMFLFRFRRGQRHSLMSVRGMSNNKNQLYGAKVILVVRNSVLIRPILFIRANLVVLVMFGDILIVA